ncbi:MAG: zinc ABC transporter substrate-binding protein [Candidatus Andersenbacteria bacterium]|nr:zinc ABC transporter substrate-binding protein [Candidatus Andersenbacteria bacterium]
MKKNNLIIFAGGLLVIFAIIIFIISNNESTVSDNTDEKINIMVSILPQIDFVKNIGKDKVSVETMILPGFSPATYEPSIEQLKKLSKADLYIKIGHIPFEKTQMKRLADLNSEMEVTDSSEGIEIYENDPHIWLSPKLVKTQVENIYNVLVKIDPENKDFYENNKNEYLAELDSLDLELKNSFSKIQNKKILVFHPAFGYLARDYGFEQIAIEINGKEPSAENLANIIDTAKEENIKTIFVQKQFSQKSAEAIAKQIGGSIVPLDPLADDYVENLRRIVEEIGK